MLTNSVFIIARPDFPSVLETLVTEDDTTIMPLLQPVEAVLVALPVDCLVPMVEHVLELKDTSASLVSV